MFNLKLPTIEIIAGDTCPFVFDVQDISHLDIAANDFVAYLSISSYVNDSEEPLVSKEQRGIVDGELVFDLLAEDTLLLRGKYVYQLYITNGRSSEIYEGYLIVYANRNKAIFTN